MVQDKTLCKKSQPALPSLTLPSLEKEKSLTD